MTWADAHLTEAGKNQARIANNFWADALANRGIPAPESYYTSPLWRCLQTARLSWHGLEVPASRPFRPLIKEKLRETIGIHTCDRRSDRDDIHESFPRYPIEEGFAQHDPLWKPNLRETSTLQTQRAKELLDDVFENDDKTWISFTSHSGQIAAILRAIRHREFGLSTGAQIPVLLKAEWVDKKAPYTSLQPSTTNSVCTPTSTAPATSTTA
jgi:broad specificity phosphatase PhoE